jgi:predicted phage terminase large subunit-like protein
MTIIAAPAIATPERLAALKANMDLYGILSKRERQAQRGGLLHFVRYFWHILEPNTEFIEGWPMEAICQHLEAIAFGEINRLLMVVPPGFCKSLLSDVFFPAWLWSAMDMPHTRLIAFSYAASLTERDNIRFRDLIISPEFREMWGHKFELRQIGAVKITNDKTGWKLASSVGGVGTGERGSIVVLDDPHSIKEIESDVIRTETVRWFREAMSNRLNYMELDSIIVIMQRSHDLDVAGVILDSEAMGYCVLSIDMEFDGRRQTAGIENEAGWVDPRTEDGELAWEERFSQQVCNKLKSTIGPYAWAAQYQQMPVPRGGGILKRDWWQLWGAEEAALYGLEWRGGLKEFPPFELVIGSIDTAYGAKEENNYSAMTVWGVWIDRNKNRRLMLMFGWKKRLALHGSPVYRYPQEAEVNWKQRQQAAWGLVEYVADTCKRYKVQRLLIEDKTKGRDVADEIRRLYSRENWGVQLMQVAGDKVSRAHSVVPLFTDGMIWAPDTKWSEIVLTDCERFPKGADKDIVDTVTQALNFVRENGIVSRADEMSASLEDEMAFRPQTQSVAQSYGV